jgi:hypothetical protein
LRRRVRLCAKLSASYLTTGALRATREAKMSFWRALFGGGAVAGREPAADPVEYKGFVILAAPYKNDGQYQTAGMISHDIDGVRREHRFVRADTYASYDDAVTFTRNKARQIIDLQGERIFDRSN